MTTLYVLALAVTALLAVTAWLAHGWRRRDAIRRLSERNDYRLRRTTRQAELGKAAVAMMVERFFPFARLAWRRVGGDSRERLRQVLSDLEGVELGEASIGVPALLAFTERIKHLFIVGRSGGGKTTILLRILRADLVAGRCIFVLGSESEFFRDRALALVPDHRIEDVMYLRIADARCTLAWNTFIVPPGVDRAVAAGQIYSALKQAFGDVGVRADTILATTVATVIGRPDASLWTLARFLEDDAYRAAIVEEIEDPYLRSYWQVTFPAYPAAAALPVITRLNRFLRVPQIRAALCHPVSTVSLHEALANARIVYFDLGGLDPESTQLLGFLALAALQVELFRRDSLSEDDRKFVAVYIDELHVFADSAEGTWRELLARGRRHGLGLVLATQHVGQLPRSLQHEVSSNCSSLVMSGGVSAVDAVGLRREFVIPSESGELVPVPAADLVASRVGEGFARLGTGACALRVRFAGPIAKPDEVRGRRVQEASWRNFAAPPVTCVTQPVLSDRGGVTREPVVAGRGGAKHKLVQQVVRELGEARGFRATIENTILGGRRRVDVTLMRGEVKIAVEVAVSNSASEVVAAITRAAAAGFTDVVVLLADGTVDSEFKDEVFRGLDAPDRTRTKLLDVEGFLAYLDGLPSGADLNPSAAGYRVVVEMEPAPQSGVLARRRTLARLLGTALLRTARPS